MKAKQKYTYELFRDALPEWKKQKDSFLVRHIHRPISFLFASLFANCSVSANQVSLMSIVIAILIPICYLIGLDWLYIVGAIGVNVWMVFDCTDGNLARTVKKEAFGEFIDAASSYILTGFLFLSLGVAAYNNDGLFIPKGYVWIVFMGGLTSIFDTIARLLYQKYLNQREKHIQEGTVVGVDVNANSSVAKLRKLQDRIDKEVSLNGLMLPTILLVSLFRWFDFMIVFYMSYSLVIFLCTLIALVKRSIGLTVNTRN